MKFTQTLPILAYFISLYLLTFSNAANFNIVNRCSYTVWAAASPGGGRQLNQGQSWSLDVAPGTTGGRIWGRTNCNFDANGNGHCQTGDCGRLQCQGYGSPPNTLAEFALNQPNNLDYIDISIVDGFNIPLEFTSVTSCRDIRCTGPIVQQCPAPLRTPGGCNNPCTVYHTNQYCCTNGPGSCSPTDYSRFFKGFCPDAYSFPQDDRFSTVVFTCPGGTNYRVVFCP